MRQHSVTNKTLFTLLLLLLREHDSLELRNCVSVSHHLVAVKGEIPTQQVTPSAYKRQPTKHAIKGGTPTMKVKPNAFKRQPTKHIVRFIYIVGCAVWGAEIKLQIKLAVMTFLSYHAFALKNQSY